MTYEVYVQHAKTIKAEVETYNAWRVAALETALTGYAPRIATTGNNFHCGCGFHYSTVQELGKLIGMLAIGWHVNANHCDKYEDGVATTVLTEVIFEGLGERLTEMEACIAARQAGKECDCEKNRIEKERRRNSESNG